jgi:ATP-dependent Clp protease ATP-binding subunit ClpC
VGCDEGAQLTEKMRRKPYSVILFDEIEKAHPDVFNILLQILDDGRLTDSHGRTVDFKNTVVIMTSNVGASEVAKVKKLGFSAEDTEKAFEDMKERQYEALKRTFKPEFLNRIDDIIMFTRLEKADIEKICDIMTAGLAKRLAERNIKLEIGEDAKAFLVEKGYDAEYGARPLRRAIQKYLENALSEEILKGTVHTGSTVEVGVGNNALTFTEKN